MHYEKALDAEDNNLIQQLEAQFDGVFWCDGIHSSGRTLLERLGHVTTSRSGQLRVQRVP